MDQKRSSNELHICLHPVKERKYISQIKCVKTALIYSRASYEIEKLCLSNYSVKNITDIFVTSVFQPTNTHKISHKTLLKHFKHFKTPRHVSILSDHHQGALFLAKVILQYSQFNSYLQTRCCGSISCCVGMCRAVARCVSYDAHLATALQHNMLCCHNTSFVNKNSIVNTVI